MADASGGISQVDWSQYFIPRRGGAGGRGPFVTVHPTPHPPLRRTWEQENVDCGKCAVQKGIFGEHSRSMRRWIYRVGFAVIHEMWMRCSLHFIRFLVSLYLIRTLQHYCKVSISNLLSCYPLSIFTSRKIYFFLDAIFLSLWIPRLWVKGIINHG